MPPPGRSRSRFSRLNCGFLLDPGNRRTSTSRSTCAASRTEMSSSRLRVPCPTVKTLSNGCARFNLFFELQEPHYSIRVERAEDEELASKACDSFGPKVYSSDHLTTHQLIARVVGDLRAAPERAYQRTEIDRDLPGRFARFREVLNGDHPSRSEVQRKERVDAHVRLPRELVQRIR